MTHDATITTGFEISNTGRVVDVLENSAGTIDVYHGEAGRVGIDACLRAALAAKTLATIHAAKAVAGLYVYQPSEGGMVAIDVEVPAPVAARLLAIAEGAGVLIRR